MHAIANITSKREIQVPVWPPAFTLPNTIYVVFDKATGLASKWETNADGELFQMTNPDGVVKVITQIFVNSAGSPLAAI